MIKLDLFVASPSKLFTCSYAYYLLAIEYTYCDICRSKCLFLCKLFCKYYRKQYNDESYYKIGLEGLRYELRKNK
jgi:hypothetical protein